MALKAIMQDMINTVIVEESLRICHTLERGLQIDMKREGSVITVLLSRGDTYPSQLEYDIVIGYLPKDWACHGYEQVETSNKYWLKAKVHVPLEVKFGRPIYRFEK